jgi:hypothetical protein
VKQDAKLGSPILWKYFRGHKNNVSFELRYTNRENIVNTYGMNGDSKQKRAALIANKHLQGNEQNFVVR